MASLFAGKVTDTATPIVDEVFPIVHPVILRIDADILEHLVSIFLGHGLKQQDQSPKYVGLSAIGNLPSHLVVATLQPLLEPPEFFGARPHLFPDFVRERLILDALDVLRVRIHQLGYFCDRSLFLLDFVHAVYLKGSK